MDARIELSVDSGDEVNGGDVHVGFKYSRSSTRVLKLAYLSYFGTEIFI